MILSRIKHWSKLLLQQKYKRYHQALKKLKNTPRYTPTFTTLLGHELELVDSASFLFMYREIFEQEIYKFKSRILEPFIIDCGANIGLSSIYFKQLYPNSNIIAFEPDIEVFKVLQENTRKLKLSKISIVNKAVWNSETMLEFMSEGADGGRVVQLEDKRRRYQVQTVRLRDYLNQTVDFLKLDIEGAETEVLQDCQDLLINVEHLFVEYHSFINQAQTLHIIVNILSEAGFRIHIHPPITSPQPFYHRNVYLGMDMQLNIFAFRK